MSDLILHLALPLLLYLTKFHTFAFGDEQTLAPDISPSQNPHPYLPLLGPSPMINTTVPTLSGLCALNFSSVEALLSVTATDCWDAFAPYLSNVICCPQFDAMLATLVGQSSLSSGKLALDSSHSNHCLSDVEKILTSRGASPELRTICSVQPESLTQGSCPVASVVAFESMVDASGLVSVCVELDRFNDCKNAISDEAKRIASSDDLSSLNEEEDLKRIDDCANIVLRWLASKLDPLSANTLLRGLTNCEINEDCPLVFPNITSVVKECGDSIQNRTACCEEVDNYLSRLRNQIFITNVQALNCAVSLGKQFQKANVTHNIYDLCHVHIKDFSLQVESQEFGCLLPSLPSDAKFDRELGISFICDLNDNIAASWPSPNFHPISFCNKTTEIPALPKATSSQKGLDNRNHLKLTIMFPFLLLVNVLL